MPFRRAGEVQPFNLILPGQYQDPETGLHQNWHRDYLPGIGRYVQSDPIGLGGGINTFSYVRNGPLQSIDPQGLVEYSDDFVGPLPPNGYYTSEMANTRCGKVPPGPPAADVNLNMLLMNLSRDPFLFKKQVENNGPWDYKRADPKYEDFGNFNYGAAGRAMGVPSGVLKRAAGYISQRVPGRGHLGSPWGSPPYGDYPEDQAQVQNGIDYCECMGQ